MTVVDKKICFAWTLACLEFLGNPESSAVLPTEDKRALTLFSRCRANIISFRDDDKSPNTLTTSLKGSYSFIADILWLQNDQLRSNWNSARGAIPYRYYQLPRIPIENNISDQGMIYLRQGNPFLAWQWWRYSSLPSEHKSFAYALMVPPQETLAHLHSIHKRQPLLALRLSLIIWARGEFSQNPQSNLMAGLLNKLRKSNIEAKVYAQVYSQLNAIACKRLKNDRTSQNPTSDNINNNNYTNNSNKTRSGKETDLFILEEIFCRSFDSAITKEDQVLILAIIYRLLKAYKEPLLSTLVLQHFQDLNRDLSSNKSPDVWCLLKEEESFESFRETTRTLRRIPVSMLHRGSKSLSFTYAMSKVLGPRRLLSLLTGQVSRARLNSGEVEKLLSLVAQQMSDLKGPLMKLGQTLSYTEMGIPSEIAFLFRGLQRNSEPVPLDFLIDSLDRATGKKLLTAVSEFDPTPIGVGSIGQVHRAVLKEGGVDVAIKFRFPQIKTIIENDFLLLKSLLFFIHLAMPRFHLREHIKTLEKNMLLECDYIQEAESLTRFNQRFYSNPFIVIPKVVDHLSTEEVLVTTLESGIDFSSACKAPVEKRNHWAKTLVKFVVQSCRDGDFNSDPHPGNFLFRDDKLVCLDFGSTQRWQKDTVSAWNSLIMSCITCDPKHLKQALLRLELYEGTTPAVRAQMLQNLSMPAAGDFWTRNQIGTVKAEFLSQQLRLLLKQRDQVPIPPDFMFGLRVYFGHMALVSKFNAVENWHTLACEIMQES
jgi:predicted unusual protein kinase regulating ubiquinone biosynthesis (AarF/ABC1/UbiB family)